MNALRDQRTRPVTSVVNPATSLVTAKMPLLKVLDVVDSHQVVVVEAKSATSAPRLATLPVTAQSKVVGSTVDMVNKVATVEATAVDAEAKPATLAVVMAICPVTAPKVKSATTAALLAT